MTVSMGRIPDKADTSSQETRSLKMKKRLKCEFTESFNMEFPDFQYTYCMDLILSLYHVVCVSRHGNVCVVCACLPICVSVQDFWYVCVCTEVFKV